MNINTIDKNTNQVKTKNYIDYLFSEEAWYSFYANNWVSQISFFHRYLNISEICNLLRYKGGCLICRLYDYHTSHGMTILNTKVTYCTSNCQGWTVFNTELTYYTQDCQGCKLI